ncbi:MAG: type IX secretion system protein PorQ [Bacteroidales bacterium]|jgi:hypothetical protein|nr:type IX secretion system protein PorQ [Bacteroidales bacterium]
MRKYVFVLVLCANVFASPVYAQTGGTETYKFLNLPVSARVSALGGKLFSVRDNNPALAIMNPSMLNPSMSMGTSLNLVDYFSNALYGHLNYIHSFKDVGTFDLGLQFASYGSFEGYDIYGNKTAPFTASDFALITGYGKEFVDSMFSMGMNVKWIFSKYESYFSAGLAVDFAASYYSRPKNLSLTLLIGNLGTQFKTYSGIREKIPLEIQLAISQRLQHLPVRYCITLQHLQKWNLSYSDPTDPFATIDAETGEIKQQPKWRQFTNNLFRHFVFGLEILPVKYISLQVSFNYDVRQEMRSIEKPGMTGFAYGAGIHVYHFDLYYARNHNNLASVPNHFTLSVNISNFLKDKK